MKLAVTIALGGGGHDRGRARAGGRFARGLVWIACLLGSVLATAGCRVVAPSAPAVAEIPVWELAKAEPCSIRPLAQARVDPLRQIPKHLVTPLCREFAILLITDDASWRAVRSRCRLASASQNIDFGRGAIVGLIASIGERPSRRWPIQLETARVRDGEGWLEFSFAAGLYYPVMTAAYLDLAYVPGLRTVRMARVGHRSFVLKASGDVQAAGPG